MAYTLKRVQPSKKPVPYSFAKMWKLVSDCYDPPAPAYSKVYSDRLASRSAQDDWLSKELLLAIFWEESRFTNCRQQITVQADGKNIDVPDGPAIGFGQVEEPRTLQAIINYFNNRSPDGKDSLGPARLPGGMPEAEWTPKEVLDNDVKAVKITCLYFCKTWEELSSKSLQEALRRYAGYYEKPNEAILTAEDIKRAGSAKAAYQANRDALVQAWLACRDKLRLIPERGNQALVTGHGEDSLAVVRKLINALNAGRLFCSACYDAFDPKASPPKHPYCVPQAVRNAFPNVTISKAGEVVLLHEDLKQAG
jgi:hypothetical protein